MHRLIRRSRERLILHYALAGGGPHIAHVEIRAAVAVVVKPRCAHSGPDVLDAGFRRHVAKPSTLVLVEIVAAKIVGDV